MVVGPVLAHGECPLSAVDTTLGSCALRSFRSRAITAARGIAFKFGALRMRGEDTPHTGQVAGDANCMSGLSSSKSPSSLQWYS
jgi:hypothetical protein